MTAVMRIMNPNKTTGEKPNSTPSSRRKAPAYVRFLFNAPSAFRAPMY